MTKVSLKFGTADNIKFIELYRSFDCLWNTQNKHYKNRDARKEALNAFTRELGVKEFGPREITAKIKNMRSQYLQERRKVKSSLGSGNVYVPKLSWYNSMDSFLKNSSEFRPTISNFTDESTPSTSHTQVNESVIDIDKVDLAPKPTHSKKIRTKKLDIDRSDIKNTMLSQNDDDLDMFGKYVAFSLRKLNEKDMIFAQDEIQATLSKFKLKNLEKAAPASDSSFSTSDSSLSASESDRLVLRARHKFCRTAI